MKFTIALILSVLLLSACAGQQEILSGLTENDANQVIVMLQAKDIIAEKVTVPGRTISYTIKVSGSDAHDALKLLVENKLPKVKSAGLAEVYPLGGGGLIPSATQERAQLMMALQGEIENMLLVLPGIVQARTVIVLPDPTVIRDSSAPPAQATASVAIVYNPVDNKGSASVSSDDIKYLVSSAVPELSPSAVTVVMASNAPARLVDAQKVAVAAASATAAAATPATGATEPSQDDNETLFMLLVGVAALGLLLGLLALARILFLRAKLRRLAEASAENI